ncbi:MAG: heparinase II/III-family protein [Magnetospirillum sp.]|nr:heparinase II/III-family protein [Magnetospirillum sp.]
MISSFVRKARRLAEDKVLCRFLLRRMLGQVSPPPGFTVHCPPYLSSVDPHTSAVGDPIAFVTLPPAGPPAPATLSLAGASVTVDGDDVAALFTASFADRETTEAVHRFAWLPLMADPDEAAVWLPLLWTHWCERFGTADDGIAWEAYTTAERAVNLLDFGRRKGLPGPLEATVSLLKDHAAAILTRLEWYGEAETCNHLANNGRALYRLGLDLGLPWAEDAGRRILLAEAERLFMASGVLREESSHYHLLYCRNYADVWLSARRHDRPEAQDFARLLTKLLGVAACFAMPGGLPLMGDISPDCPPEHLAGLLPGGASHRGWIAGLADDERMALTSLRDSAAVPSPASLAADGWLRCDHDDWSLLIHAKPSGWPLATGHGHRDQGGFELHWRGMPVFIDPGRGHYGESQKSQLYRSSRVHNVLEFAGGEPTLPNRPYYDDRFRSDQLGPARLTPLPHGARLVHGGFGKAVEAVREWRLERGRAVIVDSLNGRGKGRVLRRLVTSWAVEPTPDGAILRSGDAQLRLRSGGTVRLSPLTRWTAYGNGVPAVAVEILVERTVLPWQDDLVIVPA